MNSADNAVGIMDGAYFTGRRELLIFFNELLQLNLQKIEETATGAVACQVIDFMYPGSIQMKRVNWQAKNDYEYVSNYKLLQAAFDKHNIRRHIDVDKLIRGKYQDNLEFCQWLKAFFDQTVSSSGALDRDYDPVYVRSKGKGGKAPSIGNRKQSSSRSTSSTTSTTMPTKKLISTGARRVTNNDNNRTNANSARKPSKSANLPFSSPQPARTRHNKENIENSVVKSSTKTTRQQQQQAPSTMHATTATPARLVTNNGSAVVADAKLMKENDDLKKLNSELELLLAESEREKEFYYSKLRSIEILMEEYEKKNVVSTGESSSEDNVNNKNDADNAVECLLRDIKQSLYAPDEDEIRLEEEILADEVEMDITADVSRPENDIEETDPKQQQQQQQQHSSLPVAESTSNNILREMIGDDDEEPSLMIQDSDDDSNLIDEI